MSREEFIQTYCEKSRVTWAWLSQYRDALLCDCGEPVCGGWKMVPKDRLDKGKDERN